MSRSVDLFIATDLSLHDLAIELGQKAGCRLTGDPERPQWIMNEDKVTAILAEHPYVNDAGLPLAKYRYAISARVPNDTRPSDTPEAAVLRRIAQRIQEGPKWPVLLVHDLQYRDGSGGAGSTQSIPPPAEPSSGQQLASTHVSCEPQSSHGDVETDHAEPAGTVAP